MKTHLFIFKTIIDKELKCIVLHSLFFLIILNSFFLKAQSLNKEEIIADLKQMVAIIESTHADPYYFGGGKLVFHRRFQELLISIPDQGMSINNFAEMIQPFLAKIGDGHTYVIPPNWYSDQSLGLPLDLKVIEKEIYVSGVFSGEYKFLLNAILLELEGVPVSELLERQKLILAAENEYHNLRRLIDGLKRLVKLKLLLPGISHFDSLKAKFKDPNGKTFQVSFFLNDLEEKPMISNKSSIAMPSIKKSDFVFDYIDEEKKTIMLRIEDMQTYRECHEHWRFYGNYYEELARKTYERFHEKTAMDDLNLVIDNLPSATACFRDLVVAMKNDKTENLIIDLRKNPGGVSNITEILMYFLYGKETILKVNNQSYQIRKHSEIYYQYNKGEKFDSIGESRTLPLTINDYDFDEERRYLTSKNRDYKKGQILNELDEMASHMPTFEKEYVTGKYEGWYTPKNVIVLTTERTFSSAFWMLQNLAKNNAILVGTPSGQAPNTFSDQNPFKLKNSGLNLYLTYKMGYSFPELEDNTDVLMPHYLLTYEKLKSYKFDPNSEVIYALEVLNKK
ncbi:MAG: S41 family peptidase [Maribacter sp.]|nr:S41 family peptidase [Maribacter sp.]NNK19587.1 hypothetical protein [Maribacter sp.]